ncbi:MAG: hypothetical protein MR980_04960 [Bacteroidales bacterium]|nr:hypothetical protein [Bacteroidales bacterium]
MTLHSSARRLNGSVAFARRIGGFRSSARWLSLVGLVGSVASARRGVSHAPCRLALPGVLASALLSS